ncbi:hypothetical protein JL721_6804 [Aureococcus anophagefferens]|nr:hypothetical protein JL721_6804 [Aureococcus anophagefferens]
MARKKNKGTKRGEKENAQTKADAFAAQSLLAAIGGAADVDDAPLSASDRARLALETMRSEAAAFARAKKESPAPSPVVAPPPPPPPPAREEAVADEDEGARERLRLASERAKAMMASFRAEASAHAEEARGGGVAVRWWGSVN